MRNLVRELILQEQGSEVLEYAIVGGLIVAAVIAAITSIGARVWGW